MTATATIQRVRELAASRLADAESRYAELVETLAAGGDAHPEDVLQILVDTDRSHEDLQDDVAKVEGLAAARKQLEQLPAVLSRIAAAEQKQRDLSDELTAAQKRIGSQQEQITVELHAAMAAKARLEEVERQISIGAFDLPAQAAKRAEAAKAVAQNGLPAHNLRDELERERRKLAGLRATLTRLKAAKQPDANDLKGTQHEIAATERRIASVERELRPLDRSLSAANATFAELAGGAA